MPTESEHNLTEKLRHAEEQARIDRDRYLKRLRDLGQHSGEAATGANPLGGRVNVRDRDRRALR